MSPRRGLFHAMEIWKYGRQNRLVGVQHEGCAAAALSEATVGPVDVGAIFYIEPAEFSESHSDVAVLICGDGSDRDRWAETRQFNDGEVALLQPDRLRALIRSYEKKLGIGCHRCRRRSAASKRQTDFLEQGYGDGIEC
jgi:hypothetical protein